MVIETLRQYKIGPFAIFDFVISYLIVYLISPILVKLSKKLGFPISKVQWLWLVLPVSILTHIAVGNITPLTSMFIEPNKFYLVKITVIFMIYMGLKRNKK